MLRSLMCIAKIFIIICIFYIVFPKASYAYIDPGSGSFVIQLVIGALCGLSFLVKVYWRKIISFFSNIFSRDKKK
ncbi:MAG: hypothetical protein ABIG92_07300 [Candidatus Omnitrophota bacterium]